MLENPRVTPCKFTPTETRLESATVVGRCTVKGRVGAAIGLVFVDLNDKRFVAYPFNDRMVIIPEEPDAKNDDEQKEAHEKDTRKNKRQSRTSND